LDLLTIDRARFISELRNRNVGASVHFIPIFLHPFFKQWASLLHNHCPRSFELYPRLISLPLYPSMTEEEVKYVANAVREIVEKFRKRQILPVNTPAAGAESLRALPQTTLVADRSAT
jgi:dTDP-4-amino-4,6-dideoxygalactose transaminase